MEDVTDEVAQKILSAQGASVIKVIEGINIYHIKLRQGQEVEDAIEEFSSIPEVDYAEPNYIMKLRH